MAGSNICSTARRSDVTSSSKTGCTLATENGARLDGDRDAEVVGSASAIITSARLSLLDGHFPEKK